MDIDYQEQLSDEILSSAIKIPPLILQPFVENALWHGLSHREGNKKLTVSLSDENNWIICTITDNGIGRQKAAELYASFPEGHLSKAVSITEQRLADFNHTSQPEPLTFTDLFENGVAAGTAVTIRIRKQF
jgi:LytS/YehU family sensor histidine kinase